VPAQPFVWPLVDEFLNRHAELSHLAEWWSDPKAQPIALIGRRRVGKSWLFRRFAHGKPAVILVCDQLPSQTQLSRFADALEPVVGVRPHLPDVATLFRVLFRAARDQKLLAVIDEFPWLLGASVNEVRQNVGALLAVMEDEREASQLKLMLCGSQVSQMESLFAQGNPLHGRLQQLSVRPLEFSGAREFLVQHDAVTAFERFAVTGGMPMYLSRLATGSLRDAVCAGVLHRDAPLFNEGRRIVDQELREPRLYFAILSQLSSRARGANEIAQRVGVETNAVNKYLVNLEGLRLVSRHLPLGASTDSRTGRWRLDDSFLRFWFRFVFPYQSDLESGLQAKSLFDTEIKHLVAEHVAPVFEDWCLSWMRMNTFAGASRFGAWWGNAANEFRRTGERSTEEIDGIGTRGDEVVVVAEAKWTSKPMGISIVDDLQRFKIPALRQALRVADRPQIVLFSKSGYSPALVARAVDDPHLTLVGVAEALDHPDQR
jgi:uncharacterized protein